MALRFSVINLKLDSSQNTPRKVFELMGNVNVGLACGRRHTLVLTSNRAIYGFGLNSYGF